MRPTLFLAMLLACAAADGHGLSLARLDIEPLDDARWLLQWSAPPGSAPPALVVGPDCALQRIDAAAPGRGNGRTAARWETSCSANVRGWTLTANDLPAGLPVIASVAGESAELHAAGEPFVVHVGGSPSVLQVARSYLEAGVVHVMGGADHLLMLLCLALLAVGLRRLLVAATMFTIGHTLTLVATTLGWIRFDPRLGELLIACTLAWSAVALASERRGRGFDRTQLPAAALLFGLVHGLGFASALGAVGLPRGALLLALASFNFGVEAGQVLVIGIAVLLLLAWRALPRMPRAEWVAAYGVGSMSVYWILERF